MREMVVIADVKRLAQFPPQQNHPDHVAERYGKNKQRTQHGEWVRGFRRVKMRLGRSIEYDTAVVQAVRAAIGPDNDLIVDASMRYDLAIARRIGKVLEANGVFWYEEPFAPEDLDRYTALRGTVGVPIAAGENEFGAQGFRELLRTKAVDIVQPDCSRCGGISG